jgi:hypothetical protein
MQWLRFTWSGCNLLDNKIDVKRFHCIQLYTMEKAIQEYLQSLSPKQYKAYEIARDHLRDSFQIEKSNGFLTWLKKKAAKESG